MITLQSQQNITIKAVGLDASGNVIELPSGTQCAWSVGAENILAVTGIFPHPDQQNLISLGPAGSSSVSVSVTLPDGRVLEGTTQVTVEASGIVTVQIIVL